MSDPDNARREGTRPKIGPIDGDPVSTHPDLEKLSAYQRGLREALLREFKARKVKKFVEKQVQHLNTNRQIVEGIKFLFDEHGAPPRNAPLEDIVQERRNIEYQIRWFEAVLAELRNRLVKVREIEDYAFETLGAEPLDK